MRTELRRTLVLLTIGVWLGVSACTWAVAALSFVTVQQLASPGWEAGGPADRWREVVGTRPEGIAAARHQAAELNRRTFSLSARVQLMLAGVVVLLVASPPRMSARALIALVLAGALALVLGVHVVPTAAELGRELAFEPRPLPAARTATGAAMERLHALYGVLDVTKVGLLLLAVAAVHSTAGRQRD